MVRVYLFQVGRAAVKNPFATPREKMVTCSLSSIETTLPNPHVNWLVCYGAMLPLAINKKI
jgi:hypothetical protein